MLPGSQDIFLTPHREQVSQAMWRLQQVLETIERDQSTASVIQSGIRHQTTLDVWTQTKAIKTALLLWLIMSESAIKDMIYFVDVPSCWKRRF